MKYLNDSGITLTTLEVKVLEKILAQGSFYEESQFDEIENMRNCFFGWGIDETEVKGCDGAIASLIKKGVISAFKDCGDTGYYTNYAFKFDENSKYYHKLDLTGVIVR